MQRNGMSDAELAAFHDALQHPVRVRRTRVLVMDRDRNIERDVVVRILDGQVAVDVDAGAEQGGESQEIVTTRTLAMTVADPTRTLGLEPSSVGDYPIYPQKLVQVRSGIKVGPQWRETCIHTGPLTAVQRGEQGSVEVAAQGMEALAQGQQPQRSWKPKTPKTDIIRALLRGAGEKDAYIQVPDLPKRVTAKRFVQLDTDNPWRRARALAKSMGYELFYDGRGVAVMRRQRDKPVFTFGAALVLGDLVPTQQPKPIVNTFEVVGGKPKGSKKRVTSGSPRIELDPDHEWSARSLGRNDVPMRLVQRESNDQFLRKIDCRYRAFQMRAEAVRLATEIPAEVVSVPHLDELDRVLLVARSGQRTLTLRQFTIPVAGQSQALGTLVRTGKAYVPPKPTRPKKRTAKKGAKKAASGRSRAGRNR